ncbi:ANTAR domain-containing protein [Streptomyces melanogenes]|uniref:ANTAR domain-containing protein n=1 Tax=Streptomyces melanogenes TaxID=67326 RepID=UPI0037B3B026
MTASGAYAVHKTLAIDGDRIDGGRGDRAVVREGSLEAQCLELRLENEQLRRALDSRAVIDQARGMVMVLASCTRGEAWALLVDVSQQCNAKLRVVAGALVGAPEGAPLPDTMQRALRRALRRHRSAKRRSS